MAKVFKFKFLSNLKHGSKRYKQVILVREDLNMPKGKMASQVAHASVACVMKSKKERVEAWKKQGMKKVVLRVKDVEELIRYKNLADEKGLVNILITDAGKTVFQKSTITCLGIGPDEEEKIDGVSGELPVY
ncbi:MAG: peptidyl-tRNA hydrolase Pth2 [Candidatus Woesearchaeota archaeon]|nr:peptidyl-tRNA hydrolase Pth2 [Candidatus Woesearchaeota archaeon]